MKSCSCSLRQKLWENRQWGLETWRRPKEWELFRSSLELLFSSASSFLVPQSSCQDRLQSTHFQLGGVQYLLSFPLMLTTSQVSVQFVPMHYGDLDSNHLLFSCHSNKHRPLEHVLKSDFFSWVPPHCLLAQQKNSSGRYTRVCLTFWLSASPDIQLADQKSPTSFLGSTPLQSQVLHH